jgi:hypothetical protein
VKDYECDGNGVYVDYKLEVNQRYGREWDSSGCDGGATYYTPEHDVSIFRLCENRVSCTAWTVA